MNIVEVDFTNKERVISFGVIPEGPILPKNLAFLNFFRYGLGLLAQCAQRNP
jgi:hypothetical protein